LFFEVD
nr:Chain P, IL-1beta peptide [Homo sapiens]7JWQ_V Chain V, IL-1beta peptide [Homo sapiens]